MLTTRATCDWTTSAADAWVTVQPASGAGSSTITYVVASNESSATRVGHFKVQDITVTVAQAGRAQCTYDVSPRAATFSGEGGNGTLHVLTAAGCPWKAESNVDWIGIVLAGPGQGQGDVGYAVSRNGGATMRTGVVSIAGVQVLLTQIPVETQPSPADCDYQVSPTEFVLHWHQTVGEVNLATRGGCPWTVTSGAGWLGLGTPGQGTGSAGITFTSTVYKEEGSRRAPLQVRWPFPTAGQNVWVTQEGCLFALSRTSQAVSASGASDRIDVFGDPVSASCPISCSFTAVSNASWVRITSQGTGTGMRDTGWVFYTIDANTTGVQRTATITVETKTLTITQAGS
ncbi:MAG: BACON domain-containing protein [Acidobacteria bacterium]|nr:BACON domain-containing protein [Acidobacteriota bacterium]